MARVEMPGSPEGPLRFRTAAPACVTSEAHAAFYVYKGVNAEPSARIGKERAVSEMARESQDILGFGRLKEWLTDQVDRVVSLLAALAESDSRLETEEIEASDDP
jgi:hypothetical protein